MYHSLSRQCPNKAQLSSNEARTVTLMPLETVLDIQLNNQDGYSTDSKVKAITTYRLVGKSTSQETDPKDVISIESSVVEIR